MNSIIVKRLFLFITSIVAINSLFVIAVVAADAPQQFAMPVEASAVTVESFDVEVTANGNLEANESIIVRPEIVGRIDKIHIKEGERVTKDQELFSLDSRELRAQVDTAEAVLKLREISFDRTKKLFGDKLVSPQEFDQVAAQVVEAKSQVSVAQERLRKTVLLAPFAGVLGLRKVSVGEMVQPGQALIDLQDISSLKVDFRVAEQYLPQLRVGLKIDVLTDAMPGRVFHGEVYVIAPTLDQTSRSIIVRAHIANTDDLLRPGMFGRVKLRIAHRDNAILIPEEALWPVGNEQFVFRLDDGKAVRVKIKTGFRRGGLVEVVNGLNKNDTVITAGLTKIRDGAAVMVPGAKPVASEK